ncbi:uncharacterized protein LOC106673739 [Cimex lectularius]|uniref:Uncharacterized protein n=1 Tax=Cimex lectularius TaxID=79782 RepID=A0A8I6S9G5_CIMLE|nr:uncharacterized protein LOC106673739 [Cimex lectularius]
MGCCDFFVVAFTIANMTNGGYNSLLDVGLEKVDTWSQAKSNKVKLPDFIYPLNHQRKLWIPSIICSQGKFVDFSDLKKSKGNVTYEIFGKTRYIGLYLGMDSLNLVYDKCQFSFFGMSTTNRLHWTISNAMVHVVISFEDRPDRNCQLKLEKVKVVRLGKVTLARRTGLVSRTLSSIVQMITSVFKNSVLRLLDYHLTIGIKKNLPVICQNVADYYSTLDFNFG